MRIFGAVLAVGLMFSACSLVSLDGLSGKTDANTTDGSGESARSVIDARAMGQVGEEFATVPDAGEVPDSASPFCPQPGAILCADFEDPGTWEKVWSGSTIQLPDASVVERVTDRTKGSAGALHVVTGSSGGEASLFSEVRVKRHMRVSFDVFIKARGGNSTFAWFAQNSPFQAIYFKPSATTYSSIYEVIAGDAAGVPESTNGSGLATGQWNRVVLEANSGTGVATFRANGLELVRKAIGFQWALGNYAVVFIGSAQSVGMDAYYDNVALFSDDP